MDTEDGIAYRNVMENSQEVRKQVSPDFIATILAESNIFDSFMCLIVIINIQTNRLLFYVFFAEIVGKHGIM